MTRIRRAKIGAVLCVLMLAACGGSTDVGDAAGGFDALAETTEDPGTPENPGVQDDGRDAAAQDPGLAFDDGREADPLEVDVPPEAIGPDVSPGDPIGEDTGADLPPKDQGEVDGTLGDVGPADAVQGDPGILDEGAADPGTMDQGVVDPGSVDEGESDPGTIDPGASDPGSVDEGAPDPGTMDPGASDPGSVDEGAPDPGTMDPGASDPGSVADGTLDPAGVDPGADAGPVTVTVSPAAPEDIVASYLIDAGTGSWMLFGGADLPLGRHWDEGHVGYHAALRFPAVPVPAGAIIESAVLAWYPTNEIDSARRLWLKVTAERTGDSAPLSLSEYDSGRPDQRLHTDASIGEWAIRCNSDCNDITEYDCPQRKRDCWDRAVRYECPKDLKTLVSEVVGLPGWKAGNALTIFLDPNVPQDYIDTDVHSRSITGVDPVRGPEFRPTLTIRYR